MPNPTIPQIRNALGAQIGANAQGLRDATTVPDEINPPVCVVRPSRGKVIDYQETFDGGQHFYFEAVVLAAVGATRAAQTLLDGFLSPTGAASVLQAVQKDPTLGGVVSWAAVTQAQGYGLVQWAGVDYLGSTLIVEVMAP